MNGGKAALVTSLPSYKTITAEVREEEGLSIKSEKEPACKTWLYHEAVGNKI
jgi:hypothetical protein